MSPLINHILIVLVPLTCTNILHMVLVKRNGLSFLALPIHTAWFGKNKTWRGVLFISLVNGAFLVLFNRWLNWGATEDWLTGLLLGLAYAAAELPNSWFKRRMGIPSGGSPEKYRLLFALMDKSDSALGVALMYFWLGTGSLADMLIIFLCGVGLHILFSALLVWLHIKSSF
ncbi:MAG: hypothetical protein JNL57_07535 [Bacteroidetes bacterium]|nr:hypothetical protein [Bacteroidota bacterium]